MAVACLMFGIASRLIGKPCLMTLKTFAFIALASVTLPATASAASVDANRVEVSREVQYGDLDLASAQGRGRFDARINSAVRSVCGIADSRDLKEMAQMRRCRREALALATTNRELAIAQTARRTGVAMAAVTERKLGQ